MSHDPRTFRRLRGHPRRRGVTVVLFAVILVFLMVLVAMSIDIGYVCSVKADLQTAADAGALAGAGMLMEGEHDATACAKKYAASNLNNQGVRVEKSNKIQVEIGHWNTASREFIPGGRPRDAVQVITTSNNSSLFFNKIASGGVLSQARAVAAYRPRDIMLVLDVSGSMNEARNGVRKIDELRNAVRVFMKYIRQAKGQDHVGFTYYSTRANLGMGLSSDLQLVEDVLLQKLVAGGSTNISDGMLLAREEMNRNRREQSSPLIVVLTDGAANTIQPENVMNVPAAKGRVIDEAYMAKRDDIPIFTMALDSRTAEVDVDLMAQVAEITGSETCHIIAGERGADGKQLQAAFRRVAMDRPLRLVD